MNLLRTRAHALTLSAAAVAVVYAFSALLLRSSVYANDPSLLATAITLDLTATATLLVYLLAVRPGHLPRVSLVAVFFAGVIVANATIPAESRRVAELLGAGWVLVELALAATLLVKLRRVAGHYRATRAAGARGIDALESALELGLGHPIIARMLSHELAILYYGTAGLFRRGHARGYRDRDEAMWSAAFVGLLIVLIGEAVCAHLLLRSWSPTAAIIVGVGHLYSLLWLVGDVRALKCSPGVRIDSDTVHVELGLRARGQLPRQLIDSVQRVDGAEDITPEPTKATILGAPNVVLRFREPVTLRRSFGRETSTTVVGLAVASPAAFVAELTSEC